MIMLLPVSSNPLIFQFEMYWHRPCYIQGKVTTRSLQMPLSLNNALDLHAQALQLRSRRAEVLASNLANADTPNYKARDIDFSTILGSVQNPGANLKTTDPHHISSVSSDPSKAELLYRQPYQPTLDGNTVEMEVEQAQFADNAVQYQAVFTMLNGRIKNLLTAIRGE
ncbi:MAG TPA: flagellar basal body rod protein FlgB [Gammaproteobacteria bacterium]